MKGDSKGLSPRERGIIGELKLEKEAREYAEDIIATVREPLLVLDVDLKVVLANKNFYQTFKVDPKETIGRFVYNLGNNQWDIPKLRQLLEDILPKNSTFENYQVEHRFETIGQKTMLLNARRIPRPPKKPKIILLAIEDITEKQEIDEALQTSERKYRSLIQNIPGVVWTNNENGKTIFISPDIRKIYGFTPEEIYKGGAKIWFGRIHLEDRTKVKKAYGALFKKGSKFDVEYRIKRKDNRWIWLHDRAAKTYQTNGEKYADGLFTDITKRKKIEISLGESKEDFRSIFDEASDGILIVDLKGKKFLVANKAICRMLGYRPAEIKNLGIDDIHPKEDLPFVLDQFKKQAKGELQLSRDLPVKKKNGAVFYADINATRVKIAGKNYLMGFFHDNTTRRKLELALENMRKAKEKAILAAIDDGVMACRNNGRVVLFNPVAEKMTGYSAKEIIGHHYGESLKFLRENDEKPGNDFIAEAISSGKSCEMTNHTLIVRKDGRKTPVAESAAPIKDTQGKIIGCVVVFRDITHEREIDKAKTEFVSLASHQLRTPLVSINWLTEMFLKGDFGEVTPKQKESLEVVNRASRRMSELIGALLNVSRLELGTFAVNTKSVAMSKLANESLADLKSQIKEKRIKISRDFSANLPPIKADPVLLKIIWQNLLANAVRYSLPQRTLTVKIGKDKNDFIFTVIDQGIGIPKKDQPRIFTKLFRADNAQQFQTEGTGLGLYIVKLILDAVGGRIWFESSANRGTTFYVTLPLRGMKAKKGTKSLQTKLT